MRFLIVGRLPQGCWTCACVFALGLVDHVLPRSVHAADAATTTTVEAAVPVDPLTELNALFRTAYAATRTQAAAAADPVVMVEGDELVLFHAGMRRIVEVTPQEFHYLKTFSHAPLAVYVTLLPGVGQPLSASQITTLQDLAASIERVRGQLNEFGLSPAQCARQQQLLTACQQLIVKTLAAGQTSQAELDAFARAQAPWQLANVDEAARVQIDALDTQMRLWHRELSQPEWQRLQVVVMGSHLPREGNLAMQYFQKLLGTNDPRRLIYAESLFEEPRAIALLGTVVLDTSIGTSFFDDPLRMHRDLLSDAATNYLNSKPWGR